MMWDGAMMAMLDVVGCEPLCMRQACASMCSRVSAAQKPLDRLMGRLAASQPALDMPGPDVLGRLLGQRNVQDRQDRRELRTGPRGGPEVIK